MKVLNNKIKELKLQIENKKNNNIKLYNSIPLASKEDPKNLKAEPILKEWREGSKELRMLIDELNKQLNLLPKEKIEINKKFVNSFGEATNRQITCPTYDRANKRLNKEIINFIS